MMKLIWWKLFPDDLDRDCSALSLAGRGAWVWILMDLRVHGGSRTLPVSGWARVVRSNLQETATVLVEIISQKVCDSNFSDNNLSVSKTSACDASCVFNDAEVTLTNRRIYRESKANNFHSLRQKRYINKKMSDGIDDGTNDACVTPQKQKQKQKQKKETTKAAVAGAVILPSVEAFRLAEKLRAAIAIRDPMARAGKTQDLQAWAQQINPLLHRDGRSQDEVGAVIDWCQQPGCFWGPNILSGKKLREKFDTLFGQMNRNGQKPEAPELPPDEPGADPKPPKGCDWVRDDSGAIVHPMRAVRMHR